MTSVWLIVVGVGVTAFFSAAEMAFIGANRLRLRHLAEAGNRTAARYLESFKQPERLLSTAMMGVTLAHIIASSVATWALIPVLGNMAAVVVTLGLTPLLLVFGEVIPKAVAREWATALILSLFRVFEVASSGLLPAHLGHQRDRERGPPAHGPTADEHAAVRLPGGGSSSCCRWSRRRPT